VREHLELEIEKQSKDNFYEKDRWVYAAGISTKLRVY
jgi:hypothetical protein